jgi:hypothetical protein
LKAVEGGVSPSSKGDGHVHRHRNAAADHHPAGDLPIGTAAAPAVQQALIESGRWRGIKGARKETDMYIGLGTLLLIIIIILLILYL